MNEKRKSIINDIIQIEQLNLNSSNTFDETNFTERYCEEIDLRQGQNFISQDKEGKNDMLIYHKHDQAIKFLEDIANK